jgi:hypothetical protein
MPASGPPGIQKSTEFLPQSDDRFIKEVASIERRHRIHGRRNLNSFQTLTAAKLRNSSQSRFG